MVYFHIFPLGPCCIWFPFSVTVVRCMKMMMFNLGLNVHSPACQLQ